MALGTPTVVASALENGDGFVDIIEFAGDDSYPAGGTAAFQQYVRDALNAANDLSTAAASGTGAGKLAVNFGDVGAREIVSVELTASYAAGVPPRTIDLTNDVFYDSDNDKLVVVVRATGAESAVADQSGIVYRCKVWSR